MNKYLMMSAAAVLAATSGAANAHNAATATITFFTGNGGCAGGMILHKTGPVYAVQYTDCNGKVTGFGQGIEGKTKGLGKNVDLSDNYSTIRVLSYDISLPLKRIGGTWSLYVTSNGVTSTLANSGTYGSGLAKHRPGAKSSVSVVKDVIAKR